MATEAWVKAIAGIKNIDTIGVAAASAAVFSAGAQLKNSSGTATQFTAATSDATFIGIAGGSTLSGQTAEVPVHRKCIVNAPLVSASYTYGQVMAGYGGSDIYTFGTGSSNTIGWFNEVDQTTITRGDVYINIFVLQKMFAVNA